MPSPLQLVFVVCLGCFHLSIQVLFDTIDHPHVIATDTIFQAIMSVEKGLFNVSLPPLPSVSSPPPPCFAVCDTDADCDPACGHCTHYGDKSYCSAQ